MKVFSYLLGLVKFFRHKKLLYCLGGPFNGQRFRQKIFFDILYKLKIENLVETGSFTGSTTLLFDLMNIPSYSCEINPKFYIFAKLRLLFNKNQCKLYNLDSRRFLDNIFINFEYFFFMTLDIYR